MALKIGSARHDENGKYTGGKAGDQTGGEVSTQAYYNHSKGWRVFRAKKAAQRKKIAAAMKAACENNKIGYDQSQRGTLYAAAAKVDFDPSKVTTACETDCSATVRVCCAYAGIELADFNTSSEPNVLLNSKQFNEVTDTITAKTGAGLMNGDILVTKSKGHTVIVVSGGASEKTTTTTAAKQTATVTAANALNIRKGGGTQYAVVAVVKRGETVTVEEKGATWSKITYNKTTGYVNNKYIKFN